MKLFDYVFGNASALKSAAAEIDELRIDLQYARMRNEELGKRNSTLEMQYSAVSAEVAKLRQQVREQTEADLFMVSARIAIKLLKGEKPEPAEYDYQRGLQNALGQSSSPYGALGGMSMGGLSSLYNLWPH